MAKKNGLKMTATTLAGVGAVNWGLVEFVDFNLVTKIADVVTFVPVEPIVYGLVAVSGVYLLLDMFM